MDGQKICQGKRFPPGNISLNIPCFGGGFLTGFQALVQLDNPQATP